MAAIAKELFQKVTGIDLDRPKAEHPRPLVDKAAKLWQLMAPSRFPEKNTFALQPLSYGEKLSEVREPNDHLLYGILHPYLMRFDSDIFYFQLHINPDHFPWEKLPELPKESSKYDSSGLASFSLKIWAPPTPELELWTPDAPPEKILSIVEHPKDSFFGRMLSPYKLHILGEGPRRRSGKLDFELSGYNADQGARLWTRVDRSEYSARTPIDETVLNFRREFVDYALQQFIDLLSETPKQERLEFDQSGPREYTKKLA